MKIAIVAPSPVPFVIGGAENLWWGLVNALNAQPGVQADLLKVPSPERNMGELLSSYRHFSSLDLDHFDLVISTKYPAWAIRHRNHVVYLQHTLRGLYDCYPERMPTTFDPRVLLSLGMPERIVRALVDYRAQDVEFDELLAALDSAFARAPDDACWAFPGPVTRAAIRLLDAVAMRPDKIVHYAAISQVVAKRDGYFPVGAEVAVHHHPTNLQGLAAGPQQTIFSASRLDSAKRIDIIIEAYKASGVEMPLNIAGSGPDEARLRAAAGDHPGIRFLGRVPDAVLAQEYARAVCVPFVPRDEDYGLITLEAMLAAKPVIATTDSGGPKELIEHGHSGLIVEPDARALAEAMRMLCNDLPRAKEMGLAAQSHAAKLNWDALCAALLGGARAAAGTAAKASDEGKRAVAPAIIARRAKPVLGVLNTYPIAPVVSGGKLRLHGLYSRVADEFDVRFVNLAAPDTTRQVLQLKDGFSEELVPKSRTFVKLEGEIGESLGASVTDLTAAMHPRSAPQWLEAIDGLARMAQVMVCSHPYALPALREVSSAAFVYEAHNVEADLKRDIYGPHQWAVDRVAALERQAVREAALVTACSPQDRDRLHSLYEREDTANLIVVPNGIDVDGTPFRQRSTAAQSRAKLGVSGPLALFMGSAHGPNADAARVIFEAAARLPHVQFLLLGSVCDMVARWDRPGNIGLAGVISDTEKQCWLEVADMGLNPVVSGSGTNLKLIEYAAAGLPIVSTAFGARGVGFCGGRDYVEAGETTLADGIADMLRLDEASRDAMIREARSRVEEKASWPTIARAYSDRLKNLVN
ncbi:glycosyltransferase family 4 protein [Paraburkholderia sp. LEh10]|uniref:glycosyltransferase family 4 protein n=1 Tax=Paraburkholderia sp. LEh10 TaxID=2821353 RepID=UPI001AEB13CD|nr:glycosyltransferase family 4 protein [Paraburkholderia sp. LEh10]MBP0595359.1 glycosyltransferase family 4 protein [Paraburkholderia sp. LEh10]